MPPVRFRRILQFCGRILRVSPITTKIHTILYKQFPTFPPKKTHTVFEGQLQKKTDLPSKKKLLPLLRLQLEKTYKFHIHISTWHWDSHSHFRPRSWGSFFNTFHLSNRPTSCSEDCRISVVWNSNCARSEATWWQHKLNTRWINRHDVLRPFFLGVRKKNGEQNKQRTHIDMWHIYNNIYVGSIRYKGRKVTWKSKGNVRAQL